MPIDLAILLAGATGDDIYWDDAEMFARNQLLEQQLTRVDWIPEPVLRGSFKSDSWKSYTHVLSRSLGRPCPCDNEKAGVFIGEDTRLEPAPVPPSVYG